MQGLCSVQQTQYILRNPIYFAIPSMNSVYSGKLSNLVLRIWNLVLDRLRECVSINSFKNEMNLTTENLHEGYVRL